MFRQVPPPKPRKNTNIRKLQAEIASLGSTAIEYENPLSALESPEDSSEPPRTGADVRALQTPIASSVSIKSPTSMRTKRGNDAAAKTILPDGGVARFPRSQCIRVAYAVLDFDGRESFWNYVVEVHLLGGTVVTTKHRFSELYDFHQTWTREYKGIHIKFPPRLALVADGDIAHRIVDIERYLREMCLVNALLYDVSRLLKCSEQDLKDTIKEESDLGLEIPSVPPRVETLRRGFKLDLPPELMPYPSEDPPLVPSKPASALSPKAATLNRVPDSRSYQIALPSHPRHMSSPVPTTILSGKFTSTPAVGSIVQKSKFDHGVISPFKSLVARKPVAAAPTPTRPSAVGVDVKSRINKLETKH